MLRILDGARSVSEMRAFASARSVGRRPGRSTAASPCESCCGRLLRRLYLFHHLRRTIRSPSSGRHAAGPPQPGSSTVVGVPQEPRRPLVVAEFNAGGHRNMRRASRRVPTHDDDPVNRARALSPRCAHRSHGRVDVQSLAVAGQVVLHELDNRGERSSTAVFGGAPRARGAIGVSSLVRARSWDQARLAGTSFTRDHVQAQATRPKSGIWSTSRAMSLHTTRSVNRSRASGCRCTLSRRKCERALPPADVEAEV